MTEAGNATIDRATISCTGVLRTVGGAPIIVLPEADSVLLLSRGMVMTYATIGSERFLAPFEPDGKGSHWLRPPPGILEQLKQSAENEIHLQLELVKEWPEPDLPDDLQSVLDASPQLQELWNETTPLARWDWIRWIRSTNNPATRNKRIQVACSKLRSGLRRPCCFNRSMCTDPTVSRNGVLL